MTVSESSSTFRILIVGGGIAGLAAAIALRGENRSILILEQSKLNREIGATISLQPNASKFVEKEWGLGPLLKEKGSMIDKAFRICSTDGQERKRIDLAAKVEYGGDRVLYHRQDLHDTLKSAAISADGLGAAPELRVASRVVSCDCEAGTVKLENGDVLGGFDLIIGADGIRSMLRAIVVGEDCEPIATGQSAYRMMIRAEDVEDDEEIRRFLDPREPVTTMVMGNKCRLIMGPARNGDIYSVVAMIPDSEAREGISDTTWTTEGNMDSLLESFKSFPDWCKRLFSHAPELGLWQLRDLKPLKTWVRGRVVLVGDAAHAMLPTQGQGASQCIEDGEALGAFFADVSGKPTIEEISARLKIVEETRIPRTSYIQQLSRESAKPATEQGKTEIKISPEDYMDYCCNYRGALSWRKENENLSVASIANKMKRFSIAASC